MRLDLAQHRCQGNPIEIVTEDICYCRETREGLRTVRRKKLRQHIVTISSLPVESLKLGIKIRRPGCNVANRIKQHDPEAAERATSNSRSSNSFQQVACRTEVRNNSVGLCCHLSQLLATKSEKAPYRFAPVNVVILRKVAGIYVVRVKPLRGGFK